MDSSRVRVLVYLELLNKTQNNPFIASLVTTGIQDMVFLNEIYTHSLPKSCGLKLRIRLKSG
jgi:hypothetical protein